MIRTLRLQSTTDPLFATLHHTYETSFPEFERRTLAHQQLALASDRYHLDAYLDGDDFIGFVAYWAFDDYVYIEHYAVDARHRGAGHGSRLMTSFLAEASKTVILEIDPAVDTISRKRLAFYRELGFVENTHAHVHPPYHVHFQGHALTVLSSDAAISEALYRQFSRDLASVVMDGAPASGLQS